MTARKPMVAANWKMNKTAFEARELIQAMLPELKKIEAVDIVLCPPFTNLSLVCEQIAETDLKLGAQNMHWQEKGAFTGEISASMLTDFCDYVILGHSERRQMFGETNETVNKKAHTALAHDLKPIICVGESLEQNQAGETAQVVETQCRESLQDITPEQAAGRLRGLPAVHYKEKK